MAGSTAGADNRRTDTRERILSVALRLFASQGYANTSLRQIADELGVTKAALYFHFKTKEDIVTGILTGYLDGLNALIDGAGPGTTAGREQLLRRFAEHQAHWGLNLMKLIRENFTEIGNLPFGLEIKKAFRRLIDTLAGPGTTVLEQTRARTALVAIQSVALAAEDPDADEAELRKAALAVALEVLHGR